MTVHFRASIWLLLLALACCLHLPALAEDSFPGGDPDSGLIRMQQKVDELFERGDYKRAAFNYREQLAPLGDKYAQYMLGYMHLVGKGVPKDVIGGSAWYRLAAERGDANFVKARDEILVQMNDAQLQESHQKYLQLRLIYSDAAIVSGLVEKDLKKINGSGLNNSLVATVRDANDDSEAMRPQQYDNIRRRITLRMEFLQRQFVAGKVYSEEEYARYERLKAQVATEFGGSD